MTNSKRDLERSRKGASVTNALRTVSSGPETNSTDTPPRFIALDLFRSDIQAMLTEKEKQYGVYGGFYENNSHKKYDHALGELRLKLREFESTGNLRMLMKAATWLYLVYEMEVAYGARKD